jgi:hypothetical protein
VAKKIKIQARGDFGLYEADAEKVAEVQNKFLGVSTENLRARVEERSGHDCPWPRPVLEIMWAEWEVNT